MRPNSCTSRRICSGPWLLGSAQPCLRALRLLLPWQGLAPPVMTAVIFLRRKRARKSTARRYSTFSIWTASGKEYRAELVGATASSAHTAIQRTPIDKSAKSKPPMPLHISRTRNKPRGTSPIGIWKSSPRPFHWAGLAVSRTALIEGFGLCTAVEQETSPAGC